MKTIKSLVTYAGNNVWKGKTLYSIRVKDLDGFLNCGTNDPKVSKGDYVELSYEEQNGKFNVQVGSINILRDNVVDVANSRATVGNGTTPPREKASNNEYWSDRLSRDVANDLYKKENDRRIQYQSARNASITVVDFLLREKLLKLPAKDAYDAVMGKIEDLTEDFFRRSSSLDTGAASSPELSNHEDNVPWDVAEATALKAGRPA